MAVDMGASPAPEGVMGRGGGGGVAPLGVRRCTYEGGGRSGSAEGSDDDSGGGYGAWMQRHWLVQAGQRRTCGWVGRHLDGRVADDQAVVVPGDELVRREESAGGADVGGDAEGRREGALGCPQRGAADEAAGHDFGDGPAGGLIRRTQHQRHPPRAPAPAHTGTYAPARAVGPISCAGVQTVVFELPIQFVSF